MEPSDEPDDRGRALRHAHRRTNGGPVSDARILDRGYRKYDGERSGLWGSIRSLAWHTTRSILGLVVRSGLQPVAIGVALGLLLSLWATRLLRGLLYGVAPTDPATVATVVTLLFGAAVVASLVPARRATRVDPARVLQG